MLIGGLTSKEEHSRWQEEMVMKLTILVIIAALGVMIPLLWITGALKSIVYFIRHRENITLNPQLGLTMADGGDPLGEEKKEPAAVKQVSITETLQSSPEQITQRPVTGKMFWWGGYY
jgi:hypothetical protein